MKKYLAWVGLIVFSYFLICASSQSLMKIIGKNRSQLPFLLKSDKYFYGDLYGFSFLSKFRKIESNGLMVPASPLPSVRNKDLYILCDSYIYGFFNENLSYFSGVENTYFTRWSEDTLLDSKKLKSTNPILLIECVERNAFARLKLAETTARLGFISNDKVGKVPKKQSFHFPSVSIVNKWIKECFYHPTLETNLDFVLFSRGIYRSFKEWKASLNLSLFGRTDNFVALSKDASFLYLKETIDSTQISSSFYPISVKELDELVANLNEINDYYLKAGFKKVLISIPANPVAILQTEDKPTNQFLNRLKKHPNLQVEIVDPSDSLKVNASQNYFKSDSHWNTNGAKIWLAYLNRSLDKI